MHALTRPGNGSSNVESRRTVLLASFVAAVALIAGSYWTTFYSLYQKWDSDAGFSHGFLILPLTAWLVWRLRDQLRGVPFRPSWAGAVCMLLCVLAWVVARGTGVLVIEQFAAVAMIPSLVLAAFGWPVVRILAFPLAFLLFMVPFGRGLVPYLMHATAYVATLLVQWTGIPVVGDHMYIRIPYGWFEVARACSGLNYFVTSLVLGTLYAYLFYRQWSKRILCVAAFLVFPVVLNILRVYIIVVVSYMTEFRFGPGQEHVFFGRIFFLVVLLVLFWVGRRWHDPPLAASSHDSLAQPAGDAALRTWWAFPLALGVALSGPPFVRASLAGISQDLADTAALAQLPRAPSGWSGPDAGQTSWRPHYSGAVVEAAGKYRNTDPDRFVDVYVAVYGVGASHGNEMISYRNVISSLEIQSLAVESTRQVVFPDGSTHTLKEVVLPRDKANRLVWYWYVVGDRPATSPYAVKALEAVAFATGNARSERIVTLSTTLDDSAPERLEAFLTSIGSCAVEGFQAESCR